MKEEINLIDQLNTYMLRSFMVIKSILVGVWFVASRIWARVSCLCLTWRILYIRNCYIYESPFLSDVARILLIMAAFIINFNTNFRIFKINFGWSYRSVCLIVPLAFRYLSWCNSFVAKCKRLAIFFNEIFSIMII